MKYDDSVLKLSIIKEEKMSSESHGSTKVVITALVVNLSIAFVKAIASFLSGSASMFAETIHSFVDCGNQLLLLVGFKRSEMKANKQHQMGHHREIYFWSFVVSVALFLGGGIASIRDGWDKTIHPEKMNDIHILGHIMPAWYMNVAILGISALLESKGFFLAWNAMKTGNKNKNANPFKILLRSVDPGLFIVMFEDGAALMGLSIAFVFTVLSVALNMPALDGIASMIIGSMLVVVSFILANETRSLLIGESNVEVGNYVKDIASKMEGVMNINYVKTEHHGPKNIFVLVSIDWNDDIKVGFVEESISKMETVIKKKYPSVSNIVIEARDARHYVAEEITMA